MGYGELCLYVAELGYKVSYAERQMRHLMEDGKISAERSRSKRNTEYISAYLIGKQVPKQQGIKIIIRDGSPVAVYE